MITVDIKRNRQKAIEKIKVSGHAGYAPRGEDIICAGVSALTQAAVMGLERHLKRDIAVRQSNDALTVKLVEQPDELTDAILETMLIGLWEIAKLYPKNVRIIDLAD